MYVTPWLCGGVWRPVTEQAYDYHSAGFAEDKLAALAAQLRTLNPTIFLVFYYNANLDLTDYHLFNVTAQWWLRNSAGKALIAPIDSGAGAIPPFPYNGNALGGVPVYDFTVPAMLSAWVEECFTMTANRTATGVGGGFDGCMVDRWTRTPFKGDPPGFTKARIAAWTDARTRATSALLARAHPPGDPSKHTYLVGEGFQVDAQSDPGYFASSGSLANQMALAAAGKGLLASYKPGSVGTSFTSTLAKFLIGAGTGHYFGAGAWTCDHTSREGASWKPEYDMPLGDPLSNATQTEGGVWTRQFRYGTNVTFNHAINTGTIAWGQFPADM